LKEGRKRGIKSEREKEKKTEFFDDEKRRKKKGKLFLQGAGCAHELRKTVSGEGWADAERGKTSEKKFLSMTTAKKKKGTPVILGMERGLRASMVKKGKKEESISKGISLRRRGA